MVAAHSCCESTLCNRSCNCGELAMVSAARKAMTMLMPIPARAFMPAGDLVDARHCASFSNPLGACRRIQFCPYSYSQAYSAGRLRNDYEYESSRPGSARFSRVWRSRLGFANFCCGLNALKDCFRETRKPARETRALPGTIARLSSTSAGQRSGVALPIALMIGGAKIYFIVFGILTIAGGVLGYVKAGSMASIIAGSISGVLLLLAAWLMPVLSAIGIIVAIAAWLRK